MAGPPKKNHDTIMARAVMLPITDFNPATPRLSGREERLKAMISNMEANDKAVRNRMFSATFSPEAIEANKTRPEISTQTTPEVLAAMDSLGRNKEYNQHAAESRQFLVDTLKKYERPSHAPRSNSAISGPASLPAKPNVVIPPAFTAPMAPMALMTPTTPMEGVERTNAAPAAPTAPMMSTVTSQKPATSSNVDASRDPRRR